MPPTSLSSLGARPGSGLSGTSCLRRDMRHRPVTLSTGLSRPTCLPKAMLLCQRHRYLTSGDGTTPAIACIRRRSRSACLNLYLEERRCARYKPEFESWRYRPRRPADIPISRLAKRMIPHRMRHQESICLCGSEGEK